MGKITHLGCTICLLDHLCLPLKGHLLLVHLFVFLRLTTSNWINLSANPAEPHFQIFKVSITELQSGPEVIGHSLFLAPVTRLQHWSYFFFFLLWDEIFIPNPCLKIEFPLPTPFSMLHSIVESVSNLWINTENGEWGKLLIIIPTWSNTYGPDCCYYFNNFWVLSDFNSKGKSALHTDILKN